MKKQKFNALSLCVAVILMFTAFPSAVMAQDNAIDAGSGQSLETDYVMVNGEWIHLDDLIDIIEGEIAITPSRDRINSNGTFTFEIMASVTSTSFQFSKTSAKINTSVYFKNPSGTNVTSSYPDNRYEVVLYKKGGFAVARSHFNVAESQHTLEVSGLDTSATYYILFINSDWIPGGTYLCGSGSVTNYVHP